MVTGSPGGQGQREGDRRPAWRIRVLGRFEVARDGRGLASPTGVPLETVKLLATCGPLHVEEVAETLWPDVRPDTGRRRLRNVLLRVRDAYGPLVERREEVLALIDDAEVDVWRFRETAQAALLCPCDDQTAVVQAWEALGHHRGELLPADRFRQWTVHPRRRVRDLLLGVLDRLAHHALATGCTHEAIWLLQHAIEYDPWAEDRYLTAAQLLHDHGFDGRAATMLARARAVAAELGLPLPEPDWAASWKLPAAVDDPPGVLVVP